MPDIISKSFSNKYSFLLIIKAPADAAKRKLLCRRIGLYLKD